MALSPTRAVLRAGDKVLTTVVVRVNEKDAENSYKTKTDHEWSATLETAQKGGSSRTRVELIGVIA
jgi:hypothetical protein